MHHVPPSLARQRFNARRRERKTPIHVWIAEHIVLPCVMAFAGGVLVALHFIGEEPVEVACEGAVPTAERLIVATGAD